MKKSQQKLDERKLVRVELTDDVSRRLKVVSKLEKRTMRQQAAFFVEEGLTNLERKLCVDREEKICEQV